MKTVTYVLAAIGLVAIGALGAVLMRQVSAPHVAAGNRARNRIH